MAVEKIAAWCGIGLSLSQIGMNVAKLFDHHPVPAAMAESSRAALPPPVHLDVYGIALWVLIFAASAALLYLTRRKVGRVV